MKKQLWIVVSLCVVAQSYGERLTPQQLQESLAAGGKATLIDLRPRGAYAQGTLPDALHMGVREALEKNLVGTVVFFDDGLGVNRARRAVETFTQAGKPAAELVGGYAAWKAAGFPTSERPGAAARTERYVTYQDLTGAMLKDANDVILVDIREGVSAPNGAMSAQTAGAASADASPVAQATPVAPVDLAVELPAYRNTRQPIASGPRKNKLKSAAGGATEEPGEPLYILIDSGDGKADRKAAELRANGCARVAILAGGETIIRRKGGPGLVRRGPGAGLATSRGPDMKNRATISEAVTP